MGLSRAVVEGALEWAIIWAVYGQFEMRSQIVLCRWSVLGPYMNVVDGLLYGPCRGCCRWVVIWALDMGIFDEVNMGYIIDEVSHILLGLGSRLVYYNNIVFQLLWSTISFPPYYYIDFYTGYCY